MRHSLKAILFAALSVIFAAGLQAEEHQHGEMNMAGDASSQQIIKGTGIVKDIDLNSKKITISHEAIPAIGWPAMTMRFTFINADESITALKTGSHVDFSLFSKEVSLCSKALKIRSPDDSLSKYILCV
jgi:Cu(I)/Ag(I) efflux system protein CusF